MRITGLLTCLLISTILHAQNGSIQGKVTDSSGKKPLPLTTLTVFRAGDTSIITYRLSTETGTFKIPGLPLHMPLRLLATFSGYEVIRKEFQLDEKESSLDMGTLKLKPSAKELDEVIVTSERPPVVIKKDTIEFNASAFKTLPTALLEDLLKKLPGVQVDDDGNITVNGQPVNRILVDGKRFFGDDPKMATRNLPSNLVDKIQVTDDKDQIAENNDGDMSKIGKVINLTLKKSIKKALFGKVFAGGGTDSRYEAGAIINTFRDTLQTSLLAFSNNVNRAGFSFQDVTQLGGFNRSGFNSISIYGGNGRSGLAVNGISFGGTNSGLNTSSGAGININHTPSKNLSFYGQYFYGKNHGDLESSGQTQRFFGDTVLNNIYSSNSLSDNYSQTINLGGNWRADSLTNLTFSGSVNLAKTTSNSPSVGTTDNNKLGQVSSNNSNALSDGINNSFNYTINFTKRARHNRGRTFSVYHSFSHNNNPVDNISEGTYYYYYPAISQQLLQQLRNTNSPSTSANLYLNFSNPLSKKITLRWNERFEYNNQSQLVSTFTKSAGGAVYDSLLAQLSNELRREQSRISHVITLNYQLTPKITFNLGATMLQQWIHNRFQKGASNDQQYNNLLLNTGIYWNRLNFNISQNVSAPSVNYLNPVVNNSNPLNIIYGDPNLRPAKATNFSINGFIPNIKTSMNYFVYANISSTNDAVIQAIDVNSNGVQTNRPVNVDGVTSGYFSFRVNKQFKKNPKFIFSSDIGIYGNVNKSPLLFNGIRSAYKSLSASPSLRLGFNWHDAVEINPSFSLNFQKARYTDKTFTNTDYVGQTIQSEFIVRQPRKLVLETSLAYNYISNLAPGLPKSNLYWNAALTLLMFKEDKGQLKLAVYDILNRNNNVNRYINGNAIYDSRTNVLQRYFMLTYSYNIRSMAGQKSKVGGKQSIFFF